jgi:hypothetical protein
MVNPHLLDPIKERGRKSELEGNRYLYIAVVKIGGRKLRCIPKIKRV